MGIEINVGVANIGREDRLVRACVALSLLLLGSFSLLASTHVGLIGLVFTALFGYFALTVAVAWDPLYAWLGIETRPESADPRAVDSDLDEERAYLSWGDDPRATSAFDDVTEPQPDQAAAPLPEVDLRVAEDHSPLGR